MGEVTDPELIALLELPQNEINKRAGAGEEEQAYSQSALDAFDRAISTAERLKQHPGYGSAVGSAFDPQAWGSFNPVTGKPFGGTGAKDFMAELEAMKAQVFLPMVQSMRGMGQLSNAEGQKLTDAIGALDPGMSEAAFRESLDRIIGDLTAYRDRGAGKKSDEQRQSPPAAGAPVEISTDGAERYETDADRAFAAEAQAAFDRGADKDELNVLAVSRGYAPYGPDLDKALQYRNRGGKGARIAAPVSGYRPPTVVSVLAGSPVGSYFAGAGNALTAGTLDELSSDPERAQMAKEVMRDANPISYGLGELTGGVLAMTGAGRIPGAAARPLVADAAYGAAYGAGESNENRFGGAVVGAGAAAAGSYFGGKLLDRLSNRAPSASAQKVANAKDYGVDLPLGAAGGRGAAIIDNTLSNMPGSAQVMQRSRDALSDQVENAVDDVADSFGAPASFQSMGEAAQRGARKWISRFEEVSSKAYDAIPISPNAASDLANTRATLERMTTRFQSNPKLAAAMRNTRLDRYMDALGDEASSLSWQDLKEFRSRIGEEIGDQRFSDGTLKSELRGLYGALSEDMKATAAAQGPAALRRFERANTLYRQGQERIDGALKTLLGDANDLRPEAASAAIQRIARAGRSSSDISKLAEFRKSLPKEEWGEVSNGIIRMMGQPANSEGREFSAETFVRTFADMADPAKNLLFGGENTALRQKLGGLVGVIGDLASRNSLRNTSNTAGQVLTGLGFYSLGNIPAVIAQVGGSYGAARLWTNPRFVEWATGYAKMMKGAQRAGGQPNVGKQVALLKKVAAAEPAIAQDVLGLQRALSEAFAQSPTRAAAEGQDEGDRR